MHSPELKAGRAFFGRGFLVHPLDRAGEPFAASNQSLTSGLNVESLPPAEWDKHLLYIYRIEPGPSTPVDKCAGYLVMPSGAQVRVNDREEVESPPDAASSA